MPEPLRHIQGILIEAFLNSLPCLLGHLLLGSLMNPAEQIKKFGVTQGDFLCDDGTPHMGLDAEAARVGGAQADVRMEPGRGQQRSTRQEQRHSSTHVFTLTGIFSSHL